MLADADMRSSTNAKMAMGWLAKNIELVGIRIVRWIAICRSVDYIDHGASRNWDAGQLRVACCQPESIGDGAIPTQRLFNCLRDQLSVVTHSLKLIRILQQRSEQSSRHAIGRIAAGV